MSRQMILDDKCGFISLNLKANLLEEEFEMKFTVNLTPISKKNSQQILINRATGKPFISPSKKYKEYEQSALWFIPKVKEPINEPVNVKCLFYMPTKRQCDLVNMQEAILDVMVKGGLLADDNYKIVQSMDGSRIFYDKEAARTEVTITRVKEDERNMEAD